MHGDARAWVKRSLKQYAVAGHDLRGFVLDIGSRDVNGTIRDQFEGPGYLGCDMVAGPNVHLVGHAGDLTFCDGFFDCIVSCEALEHDLRWEHTLNNAVRMLRPGGLLVITCASPTRGEHGTARSLPEDCPGLPWPNYYRGLTPEDFAYAFGGANAFARLWSRMQFDSGNYGHDTYFWGIRR